MMYINGCTRNSQNHKLFSLVVSISDLQLGSTLMLTILDQPSCTIWSHYTIFFWCLKTHICIQHHEDMRPKRNMQQHFSGNSTGFPFHNLEFSTAVFNIEPNTGLDFYLHSSTSFVKKVKQITYMRQLYCIGWNTCEEHIQPQETKPTLRRPQWAHTAHPSVANGQWFFISFHYTKIKVFTNNICMKSALHVLSITFLAYILPSMIFINGHIINIPNLCAVSLISSINFLMCWTAFITVTRMFSASVSTKACCKNVLKYVSHKKSDRATQAVPCILIPFKNGV